MSIALDLIGRIFSQFYVSVIPEVAIGYGVSFGLILFAYFIHFLPEKFKNWYRETFVSLPDFIKILFAVLVVFFVYQASSAELQPFIYFQF
jgi:hypothetical protein